MSGIPYSHVYYRNDLRYRQCEKVDDEAYQILLYIRLIDLRKDSISIAISEYVLAAALGDHVTQPLLPQMSVKIKLGWADKEEVQLLFPECIVGYKFVQAGG